MQLQNPEIVTHVEQPTAVVRGSVEREEIAAFYDSAYGSVLQALGRQGVQPAGAPFGYYVSAPTERFELEAGFPTTSPITGEGEVLASKLPAGEVARATHVGSYDTLGDSWASLMTWVTEQGRVPQGPMWEVYVTEPTPDADPATMRTELSVLLTR